MHTRIHANGVLDDAAVVNRTDQLLHAVRAAGLDRHEGVRLTDMPLLALLQHHGAATPLLDVSLDPLVGLYMAVVSPNPADDDKDGALFAIRRPPSSILTFTSDSFQTVYGRLATGSVSMYTAPDVSERLRIQRGHFILGQVTSNHQTTLPLAVEDRSVLVADTWLSKLLAKRGERGIPPPPTSGVGVFRVTAKFKKELRDWLEVRTGLTYEFIYPTAWHQPHLDAFCKSHGRGAPL
jgi:FRG domain